MERHPKAINHPPVRPKAKRLPRTGRRNTAGRPCHTPLLDYRPGGRGGGGGGDGGGFRGKEVKLVVVIVMIMMIVVVVLVLVVVLVILFVIASKRMGEFA